MTIVVDAANVTGARPDGWWRDRAGAAGRLYAEIVALAAEPPESGGAEGFVVVLEGAARGALSGIPAGDVAGIADLADGVPAGQVRVVRAAGSGDDAIVAVARELPGRRVVVTADRELRHRSEAAGATVVGPGWLLRQIGRSR